MTSKFNTKFSNSDTLGQKKQRFLFLSLAIALNPIQGGKLIDLQNGMCFQADLISNCFSEVNDVNILCFLGFLFIIGMVMKLLWKYLMPCAYFCLGQRGRLIYLAKSVASNLRGEFNEKH